MKIFNTFCTCFDEAVEIHSGRKEQNKNLNFVLNFKSLAQNALISALDTALGVPLFRRYISLILFFSSDFPILF